MAVAECLKVMNCFDTVVELQHSVDDVGRAVLSQASQKSNVARGGG